MASSIYVYTNNDDYDNLYKGKTDAWTFQTPIVDMFLKPTEGYDVEDSIPTNRLWIITNTSKIKERPSLGRTIVHFTNGTAFDYLSGDEKLVEKDNIIYNPKNNQLELFPRKLRKPLMSLRVDKVIGGKPNKKTKIIFKRKLYDLTNDRLNLFV
tara:strand:- start:247 stop:708 length:462 start_codon:yes stop_codon:yes gene_type:complete